MGEQEFLKVTTFISDMSEDSEKAAEGNMGLCRNLMSWILSILTSTEKRKAVQIGTQKLWDTSPLSQS